VHEIAERKEHDEEICEKTWSTIMNECPANIMVLGTAGLSRKMLER